MKNATPTQSAAPPTELQDADKTVDDLAAEAAIATATTQAKPVETIPLKATAASSAAAFKEAHIVPLPSGLWVEIRRVSLSSLVRSGVIPNMLLSAAYKITERLNDDLLDDEDDEDDDDAQEGKDPSEAKSNYYKALDALVVAVVLKPVLVMEEAEEADDSVWVGRIAEVDKKPLLQYTQTDVAFLHSFRDRTARADNGQAGK